MFTMIILFRQEQCGSLTVIYFWRRSYISPYSYSTGDRNRPTKCLFWVK